MKLYNHLSLTLLLIAVVRYGQSYVQVHPSAPVLFETQTLTLHCNTTQEATLYSWLLNGEVLPEVNIDTLTVSNVNLSWDGAVITCVLGTANNSVRLTVYSKEPVFILNPVSLVVDLGHHFSLSCDARGFPHPEIIWYKDGSVFLALPQTENGRQLVFPSASDEYSGVYRCRALNSSDQPVFSMPAQVTVRFRPELTVQPESVNVLNNSFALLNCSAKGNPPPNIVWFHNGEQVTPGDRHTLFSNGTLLIEAVTMLDMGVYRCEADNSLGSVESDDALLMIDLFPLFQRTPTNTMATLAGSAILNCSALAIPTADYSWLMDSQPLFVDGVRLLLENGSLVFNEIYRNDSGNYVCIASNLYGEIRSPPAELIVTGPPLAPVATLDSVGSSWLFLTWQLAAESNPPVSSYRLLYKLSFQNTFSELEVPYQFYNLTGLYPNAQYVVQIKAMSPLGLSPPSPAVNGTQTLPGLPVGDGIKDGPEELQIEHTSSSHLTIHWTVPQELLNTSYERAIVTVLNQSGETVGRQVAVNSPVNLTNLTPATSYIVQLQFSFVGGHRGPRTPRQATTMEDVPTAPTALTVVAATPHSLIISWTPPSQTNGNITNYTITVVPGNRTQVVSGAERGTVIEGLEPFTPYSISVRASTLVGQGPPFTITNRTAQDVPPPPSGFKAEPINSTTLLLSWQRPLPLPGELMEYTVLLDGLPMICPGPDKLSVLVTGLSPYTLYSVSIRASTGAGSGNSTLPLQVRTFGAAPSVSPLVELYQSCPQGLGIEWVVNETNAINGPFNETDLTIWLTSQTDSRMIATPYRHSGNLTVENVTSFTNYTISMVINNINGSGPPSSNQSILSCDAIVGPPRDVAVETLNSTAILISWQPVIVMNGELISYQINFNSISVSSLPHRNSLILTGLSPYTDYSVSVATVTRAGPGDSSVTQLITTFSDKPSVAPTLVSVQAECPNTLVVSWINSDPQGLNSPLEEIMFVVNLQPPTPSAMYNSHYTNHSGELRLFELEPDTNYTISLALRNGNGTGPASMAVSGHTLSERQSLEPQNLSATPISINTILVTWQQPSILISNPNYIVKYRRVSTNDMYMLSTRDQQVNITDLDAYTEYEIAVSANTVCGNSTPVKVVRFIGQNPPSGVIDVQVVVVLATAVVVQWSPPNTPNDSPFSYNVSCGVGLPVTVTTLSHECTGLEPATSYQLTITAINLVGASPPVAVDTITACADNVAMVMTAPDGQLLVTLQQTSQTNCNISRSDFVLVLVLVDPVPDQLFSQYSLDQLQLATDRYNSQRARRQPAPPSNLYIAANVSEDVLSEGFSVGDGDVYGGYTNHPLSPGVAYLIGLRGVVAGVTTPSFAYTVNGDPITAAPPTTEQPFPVIIVAASAGAASVLLFAIVLLACIICACSYCSKRTSQYAVTNGTTGRIERSSSFRLSAKKKALDPVDEFRANHRTEALEEHPPVPVVGFLNRLMVMRTNDNQLFLEEFSSISMTPQHSTELADSAANKKKNRYNNILPYDNNRVKLKGHNGDYINASYCSGYMKNKIYIATQGPIAETVGDFWRMVWEESVRTIVMLTNTTEKGKVKCETYWPRELGCSSLHGHLEVILDQVTSLADFTIRTFSLQKGSKEARQVKQFHFTSWPDHGVPQYATAMLSMLRRVRAHHSKISTGPMLVHCSAGVGRTGTFIVIDSMLERLKNSDSMLDIYGHVTLLRFQRNYMVQTEDQYFFIHEALAEALLCGNTEVTLKGLGGYVSELSTLVPDDQHDTTHIEVQFKRLALDKNDPYRYTTANKNANKHKNRLVNILPYETNRVVLEYLRGVDGSDYINASHIDSYHNRRAFIATQGPLAHTVTDFWRMVWQYKSPVIVMLTETMEKGQERCVQYWPTEVLQSVAHDRFIIELAVERRSEHYTFRDINITDSQSGSKRCVSHFQFHDWPEVGTPSSPASLIEFIREVQKMYSSLLTSAPITVHCSAGVGRTGVFITLHITLERMVLEGLVDIFQTVKNLRIQRPAMVQTLQQYQFCYESALHYLDSSDLLTQRRSTHSSTELSRKRSYRRTPPSSQASPARGASLSRNESFKGSGRNLERNQGAHIYGGSEATSTFGSHPSNTPLSGSVSQLYNPSGSVTQLQRYSGSSSPVPQGSPRGSHTALASGHGGSQSLLNTQPPQHAGVHMRNASLSGMGVSHQLAESQRYSTASMTGWGPGTQ